MDNSHQPVPDSDGGHRSSIEGPISFLAVIGAAGTLTAAIVTWQPLQIVTFLSVTTLLLVAMLVAHFL